MTNKCTDSAHLLVEALNVAGYKIEEICLSRKNYFNIKKGRASIIISANNPLYPFSVSTSRTIFKEKLRSQAIAALMGLNVLDTYIIKKDDNLNWSKLNDEPPYVVKPVAGAGGIGVTVGVKSKEEADTAIINARKVHETVILQKQFDGEEYRFTTVNGKVISVLQRQRPTLLGDGKSTIKHLIEVDNINRLQISSLVNYPSLSATRSNVEVDSIPELNCQIILDNSTLIRNGASVYNVHKDVNKGYIESVEKLAMMFGSGLLAIDLLIYDHAEAPNTTNYIFLEMNCAPALALYYSERLGNNIDILGEYIVPMFDKLFTSITSHEITL